MPMSSSSRCCAPRRCTRCRDPWPSSSNYRKPEMPEPVKIAFERQVVVLPLSNILPMKQVPDTLKQAMRYKRIVASIAEIGIVEPLVVARHDDTGPYMLVDGHLRHAALMYLGNSEAPCLIADDDEAFTYNKRVNRLADDPKALHDRQGDRGVGFPKKSSPGPSMSTSSGSRPSGPCSTECVPKSPRCSRTSPSIPKCSRAYAR